MVVIEGSYQCETYIMVYFVICVVGLVFYIPRLRGIV